MVRRLLVVIVVGLTSCAGGGSTAPASTVGVTDVSTVQQHAVPVSAWPMAMRDARHSGTAEVSGPRTGTIRWQRELGADATPGTVIGADGSVIAATNAGVLSALDPSTGETRWSFDGGGGYGNYLSTSAAVLSDGSIVWPGPGAMLFGLGPTGERRWSVPLDGFVLSPAVAPSGRIYTVTRSGTMSAIDATRMRAMWCGPFRPAAARTAAPRSLRTARS